LNSKAKKEAGSTEGLSGWTPYERGHWFLELEGEICRKSAEIATSDSKLYFYGKLDLRT